MSDEVVFVRRLTADRTLTYHTTTCRTYLRYQYPNYVEVPIEEVKAAYALLYVNARWVPQHVMFENRKVRINVCSSCIVPIVEGVPEWPPHAL